MLSLAEGSVNINSHGIIIQCGTRACDIRVNMSGEDQRRQTYHDQVRHYLVFADEACRHQLFSIFSHGCFAEPLRRVRLFRERPSQCPASIHSGGSSSERFPTLSMPLSQLSAGSTSPCLLPSPSNDCARTSLPSAIPFTSSTSRWQHFG